MNEVEKFLNELSESSEPDKLEFIIKTKELIKEQMDKLKATELLMEEKDNKLKAQEELIKKYEKLISEHIKSMPVTKETLDIEDNTVSDYESMI